MFVLNKLIAINKNIDKIISLLEKTDKTFTYITKVTGATTGAAGAAKGSVDLAKAIIRQDGVCVVVSAIGVIADNLQIYTSFIPGPNVIAVITLPISIGYKIFVWCCKKLKLSWRLC